MAETGFARYAERAVAEEEASFLASKEKTAAAAAAISLEGCDITVMLGGEPCAAICVRHLVEEGRVRVKVTDSGKLLLTEFLEGSCQGRALTSGTELYRRPETRGIDHRGLKMAELRFQRLGLIREAIATG